jgi:serine/threonine protein kinase
MILEFVEGRTLKRLLEEEGPLAAPRALKIFNQICKGLAEAHSHKIVHRDIKPGNVMISSVSNYELVKLLDFGISKSIDSERQDLTKTGIALGSVNYMSPEQCRNENIDARSDIYSFGCLMYECLVGLPPMEDASDFLIMSNHLNKRVEKVPALSPVSTELSNLILRCLEKEAGKRYQDATQLLSVLEKCPTEVKKNISRTPLILSLTGAFLLIGIIIATLYVSNFNSKPSTSVRINYSASKRKSPQGVRDTRSLIETEDWIKQKLQQKLSTAEMCKLCDEYRECLKFRQEHGLESQVAAWKEIESQLNTVKDPQQWADGQWHESFWYVTQDDAAKLIQLLKNFERKRSTTESGRLINQCIENCKLENRYELRKTLVEHFAKFAEEKAGHRDEANSAYQKASLLIDAGETEEADRTIVKMKKAIDNGVADLDFNLAEYAKYCELLNRRGRYLETLGIVQKCLPREGEQNIDEASIRLRMYQAGAHLGLRHAQKSASILKNILYQTLEQDKNDPTSNEIELQLLRTYDAEGKKDLIATELKTYLSYIQKNCPYRFSSSLAILNQAFLQKQNSFDGGQVFKLLIKQSDSSEMKNSIDTEYQSYLKTAGKGLVQEKHL